jgi:outer membrane protein
VNLIRRPRLTALLCAIAAVVFASPAFPCVVIKNTPTYAGCMLLAEAVLAQSAQALPDHPWHELEAEEMVADARSLQDFRLNTDAEKTYSLAELIDLAEMYNPATRVSWEHARAQAANLGVARSELYPILPAAALSQTNRSEAFFGNRFYGQVVQDLQVLAP